MLATRRSFLTSLAGAAAVPAFTERAIRHLGEATRIAGVRPAAAVAEDEAYWARSSARSTLDRTMINLNNGGCSPTPTPRARADDPRSALLERAAGGAHVARARAADRERAARPRARVRLRPRGDGDHAQRVRGERDDDLRPRPQARRRGRSSRRRTIRACSRRGTSARAARGSSSSRSRSRCRRRAPTYVVEQSSQRDHAAHAGHRGHAHHEPRPGTSCRCGEIVELARPQGIEVFVDGAHAFAHFPFTRDELGCDYYGTSLHKWLLAPIGTGFLYVRQRQDRSRSGR